MFVVRPIQQKDIHQLYSLAKQAKTGITTLPKDKKILAKRLKGSLKSFAKKTFRPGGELYFFVMENTRNGRLIGTAAIEASVGVHDPFYTYEIKKAAHKSDMLKVRKVIRYLKLKIIRNGPTEVGTLFLKPSYRARNCGRLLALSRFLFIAQYPKRFKRDVIAELRGVIDENDKSPFWNAVCKHFFVVGYKKADLMMMRDKSFIADLIPKHPIYIPILTKAAQDVIGGVHDNTLPALKLLQQEGFDIVPEIDIFEAGPMVKARVTRVRTVRKSKVVKVKEVAGRIARGVDCLIANISHVKDFRVTRDLVVTGKDGVTLSAPAARALRVRPGQKVRIVKARG